MVLPMIAGYGAGLGLKALDEMFMHPIKGGVKWFYGDNKGKPQQGGSQAGPNFTPTGTVPGNAGNAAQMRLAQALSRNAMAEGTSTSPVAGPWGALARALQGTIGGYMASHMGDMGAPGQPMGGQQLAAAAQPPQMQPMSRPGPFGPMGSNQQPPQANGPPTPLAPPQSGDRDLTPEELAGAQSENAAAENAMYATPGQAKGRTVGAMFPNGPDDLSQVGLNRAQGENAANEHGFIVLGPAPGGGYRVKDPTTGRTGTWQP